jgi:6,7-dimethyl-8-ribityllumazine synthase
VSGGGVPRLDIPDGASLRVGLVAARWHPDAMAGLLAGARRGLVECGVTRVVEVRVPGSFELPVAAHRLAAADLVDAVVALGVVVRGGTPHFEYVCSAVAHGLVAVSVETGVPVGFGVLTCDTVEQALDRAGLPGSSEDKGYEAALAAVSADLAIVAAVACGT